MSVLTPDIPPACVAKLSGPKRAVPVNQRKIPIVDLAKAEIGDAQCGADDVG
jgi:hypothetical protein